MRVEAKASIVNAGSILALGASGTDAVVMISKPCRWRRWWRYHRSRFCAGIITQTGTVDASGGSGGNGAALDDGEGDVALQAGPEVEEDNYSADRPCHGKLRPQLWLPRAYQMAICL